MVTEAPVTQSDGNTAFLRAARAGHLDKVLEHLKSDVDINTANANGLNALHLASKDGHIHVVTELLARGATVDASTKKGNTALHIASLAGQEEVVRLLVQHGAAVNVQSQNGFTPLYMAAQENHDNVVKFLLANGANQSLATEDGFTPLAVAMQQGHDKVVAVLLENDTRGKVRLPALHIAAKKDDCKAAALLLQKEHNPDVTSKSGFTPLHIAAHYGNEAIANLLLDKKADVNYSAKHNISPLHVAAKWGKTNLVALLLDRGAHIEAKTRDGLTPLHCAARSGHEQVVDMMLERGAPISCKTKNGLAPLHMAAQGDHVDAARILLYHRAPVDEVTVDYLTALHVAAHCGHVRVAKLLLERKADPNARALNGFTPLHIACKKNRIKVVELLLKYGASIEATTESGLTPLHVASFMGCMNIVIYLLQNEANPDVPTVRGETPLHLAARANQTDIIRILLRNGAQVDARAREQQTPLHIASRLGNFNIVMLLLQHGAAVDSTTKDLYTALHIAAKEGQEEVAAVLLDNGANPTATTNKGCTPLHLAAKYGNIKVAKLLLQKDAPVDSQGKNGVTPLHVASHYDHQNVALLLLDKGASPHATAKNGHTPLHIAARKNQMDIATTLLEYGAKANAESRAGFTPLHLSAQEGHTDMSTLLIEHEADVNHHAKNGLTPLHLCAQEDRVNVAQILVKAHANVDATTKAGYTPLHVASHFGQVNMVRFLLQNKADSGAVTSVGYTPLHQAAQQGHSGVVSILLSSGAQPNVTTKQGQTALSIAQKLGYISVVETLKVVTEVTTITTTTTTTIEEKYRVVAPETMQETFMSDSEEEGGDQGLECSGMYYGKPTHAQHVYLPYYEGQSLLMREDTLLNEQPYHYLTVDEMKSLGDDSLPIDVTQDDRHDSNRDLGSWNIIDGIVSPQHAKETYASQLNYSSDNVDISRHPVNVGKLKWKNFLVSFLVDARGGAMRGCRHSGVRVIVPPRKAPQPLRVTCRYLKRDKLSHPPPLMEGEALASRILELGPVGAKFLGPVIIEVPHFGSLRGREREIVILRSDNGETWREHTVEASEETIHDVLNESFEKDGERNDLNQLEVCDSGRLTRILTTDFPQYFAVVSRVRQEVHAIGPEGGMVSSSVVPQVQAVFPQGALTKKIKVGLQAQPIPADLVAKLLGNRVAVSPIVTVEPRRRKFHKPITLTIPVPQAANKGMINQYSGDAPTLRLLCSITGGTTRAQWEDVTGSTPLTFVNDCVSFTTTVSARFWLMDCRNISEATKMATELYKEAIHVPFLAKFVVFAKRVDYLEARLRVFCMTDDKEDKTLEHQEHFTEVAKSRDVEVLEGKAQFVEFAGNLVPVTKSGDQLQLGFRGFRENRLAFTTRVKDLHADPVGRILFMKEAKVQKGDPPQQPVCVLNIVLPEDIIPESSTAESTPQKFSHVNGSAVPARPELRLSDISNTLGSDWESLAVELGLSRSDVERIKCDHPASAAPQLAMAMLRLWLQRAGNRASGSELQQALQRLGRDDIVHRCMMSCDDQDVSLTMSHTGLDELGMSRDASRDGSLLRNLSLEAGGPFDEQDIMKVSRDSESVEELVHKQHIPMGRIEESKRSELQRRERDDREERKYIAEEKEVEERRKSVRERTQDIEKRLSQTSIEEQQQRRDSQLFQGVSEGLERLNIGQATEAEDLLSPGIVRTPPPSPAELPNDAGEQIWQESKISTAATTISTEQHSGFQVTAASVSSPHEDEDLDADSFQEQFLLETPTASNGRRLGFIAAPDDSDVEEVAGSTPPMVVLPTRASSPPSSGLIKEPHSLLAAEKKDIAVRLEKMRAMGIQDVDESSLKSSPEEEKGAADEKRAEHPKDIDRLTGGMGDADDDPMLTKDTRNTRQERTTRATSPPSCRIAQPPPTLELVIGHKKVRTRDASASSESRVTLYGSQDVEISIRSEAHISVTRKDSSTKEAMEVQATSDQKGPIIIETSSHARQPKKVPGETSHRGGAKVSKLDQSSPDHSSGIYILPTKKDRRKEDTVFFSGEESIYRYDQGEAIFASIDSPASDESASHLITDTGISLTRGTTDTMTSPAQQPARGRSEQDTSGDVEAEESELTDAGLSPIQPDDIGLPVTDLKFYDEEITLINSAEAGTSPHEYHVESSSVALSPLEIPTSEASVYTDSVDMKDAGVSPIASDDESLKQLSSISASAPGLPTKTKGETLVESTIQDNGKDFSAKRIPFENLLLTGKKEINDSFDGRPTQLYRSEMIVQVGETKGKLKELSPPKEKGPKVRELQKKLTESSEKEEAKSFQAMRLTEEPDDALIIYPGVSKLVEDIEDRAGTPKHARRTVHKDSSPKEGKESPDEKNIGFSEAEKVLARLEQIYPGKEDQEVLTVFKDIATHKEEESETHEHLKEYKLEKTLGKIDERLPHSESEEESAANSGLIEGSLQTLERTEELVLVREGDAFASSKVNKHKENFKDFLKPTDKTVRGATPESIIYSEETMTLQLNKTKTLIGTTLSSDDVPDGSYKKPEERSVEIQHASRSEESTIVLIESRTQPLSQGLSEQIDILFEKSLEMQDVKVNKDETIGVGDIQTQERDSKDLAQLAEKANGSQCATTLAFAFTDDRLNEGEEAKSKTFTTGNEVEQDLSQTVKTLEKIRKVLDNVREPVELSTESPNESNDTEQNKDLTEKHLDLKESLASFHVALSRISEKLDNRNRNPSDVSMMEKSVEIPAERPVTLTESLAETKEVLERIQVSLEEKMPLDQDIQEDNERVLKPVISPHLDAPDNGSQSSSASTFYKNRHIKNNDLSSLPDLASLRNPEAKVSVESSGNGGVDDVLEISMKVRKDVTDPRPRSLHRESEHVVTERDVSALISEVAECTRQIKQEVRQLKPDLTPTPEGVDMTSLNLGLARETGMSLIPEVGSIFLTSDVDLTPENDYLDFVTARPGSSADEQQVLSETKLALMPEVSTSVVDSHLEKSQVQPKTADKIKDNTQSSDNQVGLERTTLQTVNVDHGELETTRGLIESELRSAFIVGLAVGQSIAADAVIIPHDQGNVVENRGHTQGNLQYADLVKDEKDKVNDVIKSSNANVESDRNTIDSKSVEFHVNTQHSVSKGLELSDKTIKTTEISPETLNGQQQWPEHKAHETFAIDKQRTENVDTNKINEFTSTAKHEKLHENRKHVHSENVIFDSNSKPNPTTDTETPAAVTKYSDYADTQTVEIEQHDRPIDTSPPNKAFLDNLSTIMFIEESGDDIAAAESKCLEQPLKTYEECKKREETGLVNDEPKTTEQIIIEVEERLEKDIEMEAGTSSPSSRKKIKVKVKDAKKAVGGFFGSLMGKSRESDSENEGPDGGKIIRDKKRHSKRKDSTEIHTAKDPNALETSQKRTKTGFFGTLLGKNKEFKEHDISDSQQDHKPTNINSENKDISNLSEEEIVGAVSETECPSSDQSNALITDQNQGVPTKGNDELLLTEDKVSTGLSEPEEETRIVSDLLRTCDGHEQDTDIPVNVEKHERSEVKNSVRIKVKEAKRAVGGFFESLAGKGKNVKPFADNNLESASGKHSHCPVANDIFVDVQTKEYPQKILDSSSVLQETSDADELNSGVQAPDATLSTSTKKIDCNEKLEIDTVNIGKEAYAKNNLTTITTQLAEQNSVQDTINVIEQDASKYLSSIAEIDNDSLACAVKVQTIPTDILSAEHEDGNRMPSTSTVNSKEYNKGKDSVKEEVQALVKTLNITSKAEVFSKSSFSNNELQNNSSLLVEMSFEHEKTIISPQKHQQHQALAELSVKSEEQPQAAVHSTGITEHTYTNASPLEDRNCMSPQEQSKGINIPDAEWVGKVNGNEKKIFSDDDRTQVITKGIVKCAAETTATANTSEVVSLPLLKTGSCVEHVSSTECSSESSLNKVLENESTAKQILSDHHNKDSNIPRSTEENPSVVMETKLTVFIEGTPSIKTNVGDTNEENDTIEREKSIVLKHLDQQRNSETRSEFKNDFGANVILNTKIPVNQNKMIKTSKSLKMEEDIVNDQEVLEQDIFQAEGLTLSGKESSNIKDLPLMEQKDEETDSSVDKQNLFEVNVEKSALFDKSLSSEIEQSFREAASVSSVKEELNITDKKDTKAEIIDQLFFVNITPLKEEHQERVEPQKDVLLENISDENVLTTEPSDDMVVQNKKSFNEEKAVTALDRMNVCEDHINSLERGVEQDETIVYTETNATEARKEVLPEDSKKTRCIDSGETVHEYLQDIDVLRESFRPDRTVCNVADDHGKLEEELSSVGLARDEEKNLSNNNISVEDDDELTLFQLSGRHKISDASSTRKANFLPCTVKDNDYVHISERSTEKYSELKQSQQKVKKVGTFSSVSPINEAEVVASPSINKEDLNDNSQEKFKPILISPLNDDQRLINPEDKGISHEKQSSIHLIENKELAEQSISNESYTPTNLPAAQENKDVLNAESMRHSSVMLQDQFLNNRPVEEIKVSHLQENKNSFVVNELLGSHQPQMNYDDTDHSAKNTVRVVDVKPDSLIPTHRYVEQVSMIGKPIVVSPFVESGKNVHDVNPICASELAKPKQSAEENIGQVSGLDSLDSQSLTEIKTGNINHHTKLQDEKSSLHDKYEQCENLDSKLEFSIEPKSTKVLLQQHELAKFQDNATSTLIETDIAKQFEKHSEMSGGDLDPSRYFLDIAQHASENILQCRSAKELGTDCSNLNIKTFFDKQEVTDLDQDGQVTEISSFTVGKTNVLDLTNVDENLQHLTSENIDQQNKTHIKNIQDVSNIASTAVNVSEQDTLITENTGTHHASSLIYVPTTPTERIDQEETLRYIAKPTIETPSVENLSLPAISHSVPKTVEIKDTEHIKNDQLTDSELDPNVQCVSEYAETIAQRDIDIKPPNGKETVNIDKLVSKSESYEGMRGLEAGTFEIFLDPTYNAFHKQSEISDVSCLEAESEANKGSTDRVLPCGSENMVTEQCEEKRLARQENKPDEIMGPHKKSSLAETCETSDFVILKEVPHFTSKFEGTPQVNLKGEIEDNKMVKKAGNALENKNQIESSCATSSAINLVGTSPFDKVVDGEKIIVSLSFPQLGEQHETITKTSSECVENICLKGTAEPEDIYGLKVKTIAETEGSGIPADTSNLVPEIHKMENAKIKQDHHLGGDTLYEDIHHVAPHATEDKTSRNDLLLRICKDADQIIYSSSTSEQEASFSNELQSTRPIQTLENVLSADPCIEPLCVKVKVSRGDNLPDVDVSQFREINLEELHQVKSSSSIRSSDSLHNTNKVQHVHEPSGTVIEELCIKRSGALLLGNEETSDGDFVMIKNNILLEKEDLSVDSSKDCETSKTEIPAQVECIAFDPSTQSHMQITGGSNVMDFLEGEHSINTEELACLNAALYVQNTKKSRIESLGDDHVFSTSDRIVTLPEECFSEKATAPKETCGQSPTKTVIKDLHDNEGTFYKPKELMPCQSIENELTYSSGEENRRLQKFVEKSKRLQITETDQKVDNPCLGLESIQLEVNTPAQKIGEPTTISSLSDTICEQISKATHMAECVERENAAMVETTEAQNPILINESLMQNKNWHDKKVASIETLSSSTSVEKMCVREECLIRKHSMEEILPNDNEERKTSSEAATCGYLNRSHLTLSHETDLLGTVESAEIMNLSCVSQKLKNSSDDVADASQQPPLVTKIKDVKVCFDDLGVYEDGIAPVFGDNLERSVLLADDVTQHSFIEKHIVSEDISSKTFASGDAEKVHVEKNVRTSFNSDVCENTKATAASVKDLFSLDEKKSCVSEEIHDKSHSSFPIQEIVHSSETQESEILASSSLEPQMTISNKNELFCEKEAVLSSYSGSDTSLKIIPEKPNTLVTCGIAEIAEQVRNAGKNNERIEVVSDDINKQPGSLPNACHIVKIPEEHETLATEFVPQNLDAAEKSSIDNPCNLDQLLQARQVQNFEHEVSSNSSNTHGNNDLFQMPESNLMESVSYENASDSFIDVLRTKHITTTTSDSTPTVAQILVTDDSKILDEPNELLTPMPDSTPHITEQTISLPDTSDCFVFMSVSTSETSPFAHDGVSEVLDISVNAASETVETGSSFEISETSLDRDSLQGVGESATDDGSVVSVSRGLVYRDGIPIFDARRFSESLTSDSSIETDDPKLLALSIDSAQIEKNLKYSIVDTVSGASSVFCVDPKSKDIKENSEKILNIESLPTTSQEDNLLPLSENIKSFKEDFPNKCFEDSSSPPCDRDISQTTVEQCGTSEATQLDKCTTVFERCLKGTASSLKSSCTYSKSAMTTSSCKTMIGTRGQKQTEHLNSKSQSIETKGKPAFGSLKVSLPKSVPQPLKKTISDDKTPSKLEKKTKTTYTSPYRQESRQSSEPKNRPSFHYMQSTLSRNAKIEKDLIESSLRKTSSRSSSVEGTPTKKLLFEPSSDSASIERPLSGASQAIARKVSDTGGSKLYTVSTKNKTKSNKSVSIEKESHSDSFSIRTDSSTTIPVSSASSKIGSKFVPVSQAKSVSRPISKSTRSFKNLESSQRQGQPSKTVIANFKTTSKKDKQPSEASPSLPFKTATKAKSFIEAPCDVIEKKESEQSLPEFSEGKQQLPRRAASAPIPSLQEPLLSCMQSRVQTSLPSSPSRLTHSGQQGLVTHLVTSEVFTRTVESSGAIEVVYRQPGQYRRSTEGDQSFVDTTDSSLSESTAIPSSSTSSERRRSHSASPKPAKESDVASTEETVNTVQDVVVEKDEVRLEDLRIEAEEFSSTEDEEEFLKLEFEIEEGEVFRTGTILIEPSDPEYSNTLSIPAVILDVIEEEDDDNNDFVQRCKDSQDMSMNSNMPIVAISPPDGTEFCDMEPEQAEPNTLAIFFGSDDAGALTDVDIYEASDNDGDEEVRASTAVPLDSMIDFENSFHEVLNLKTDSSVRLVSSGQTVGNCTFLNISSGRVEDEDGHTDVEEVVDEEEIEVEEVEFSTDDYRVIDAIMGEDGVVDICDQFKSSLGGTPSPANTPEPFLLQKKHRKTVKAPKRSNKKKFLSPLSMSPQLSDYTDVETVPSNSDDEALNQTRVSSHRSRRRKPKLLRPCKSPFNSGTTDIEDLELSAAEDFSPKTDSALFPLLDMSSQTRTHIVQQSPSCDVEIKGPDTDAEDILLSDRDDASCIASLCIPSINTLGVSPDPGEVLTDVEDVEIEKDGEAALRKMEDYYGSVAVKFRTKISSRCRDEIYISSSTTSDDDSYALSENLFYKRKVPKITLQKADGEVGSENDESLEVDWTTEERVAASCEVTDREEFNMSDISDPESAINSDTLLLSLPVIDICVHTDTETCEDDESPRPLTPEPRFEDDGDERLPEAVRELTLLKETDEDHPESVVLPLGDAQPEGLFVLSDETAGITDVEDVDDSGDEEIAECHSPDMPELDGGMIESSDTVKIRKKRSTLLVPKDDGNDNLTDTEDIYMTANVIRRKKGKSRCGSRQINDCLYAQSPATGISDVEDIEISDFETSNGLPQGSLTVNDKVLLGVEPALHGEKTDVEDMSAPSELDDNDDCNIVDDRGTPDCLKNMEMETITSVEGDGPFSAQQRRETVLGMTYLKNRTSSGLNGTPDGLMQTDVEDDIMTSADEEVVHSARVSIEAEQSVVLVTNSRKMNLEAPEEAKYVKGPLFSEAHTDVEDIGLSEEELLGRVAVIDGLPEVCVCVTSRQAGPLDSSVCVCVSRGDDTLSLSVGNSTTSPLWSADDKGIARSTLRVNAPLCISLEQCLVSVLVQPSTCRVVEARFPVERCVQYDDLHSNIPGGLCRLSVVRLSSGFGTDFFVHPVAWIPTFTTHHVVDRTMVIHSPSERRTCVDFGDLEVYAAIRGHRLSRSVSRKAIVPHLISCFESMSDASFILRHRNTVSNIPIKQLDGEEDFICEAVPATLAVARPGSMDGNIRIFRRQEPEISARKSSHQQ